MRHRILGRVLPLLMGTLIVVSGILLPRLLLERQKARLFASSDTVKTDDLAVYGNDEISAKALEERIAVLSELTAKYVNSDYLEITLLENAREPLDTELTQDAAITVAASFLQSFSNLSELYYLHLPPLGELSMIMAYNTDADNNQYEYSYKGTKLLVAADDASLSIWSIGFGDYIVLLDAVSGIPLYISANLSSLNNPLYGDELPDLFYLMAAVTYNAPFSDSAQFAFPETTRPSLIDDDASPLTVKHSARSGAYTLNVTVSEDEEGYLMQLEVQLIANRPKI